MSSPINGLEKKMLLKIDLVMGEKYLGMFLEFADYLERIQLKVVGCPDADWFAGQLIMKGWRVDTSRLSEGGIMELKNPNPIPFDEFMENHL